MKNVLMGMIGLISVSAVFAQNVGEERLANKFKNDMFKDVVQFEVDMNKNISERATQYPDYARVGKNFLTIVSKSKENFVQNLSGVDSFLAWYESISDEYDRDPSNQSIKNLIKSRAKGLDRVREEYSESAMNLIVLDSYLTMPVSISPRVGKNVLPVVVAAAPFLMMPFTGGVSVVAAPFVSVPSALVIMEFAEEHDGNSDQFLVAGVIKDSTGMKIYNSNWGDLTAKDMKERMLENLSYKIFCMCKTQACVYYLAEDLKSWIDVSTKTVSRIEVPVKSVKDFKFKLPLRKAKYHKAIDEMADFAAENKSCIR